MYTTTVLVAFQQDFHQGFALMTVTDSSSLLVVQPAGPVTSRFLPRETSNSPFCCCGCESFRSTAIPLTPSHKAEHRKAEAGHDQCGGFRNKRVDDCALGTNTR